MALAMCNPLHGSVCIAGYDRFYKFGSPSPPHAVRVECRQPIPQYRPDLEDSGFHSDEEIQKVRIRLHSVVVLSSRHLVEMMYAITIQCVSPFFSPPPRCADPPRDDLLLVRSQ